MCSQLMATSKSTSFCKPFVLAYNSRSLLLTISKLFKGKKNNTLNFSMQSCIQDPNHKGKGLVAKAQSPAQTPPSYEEKCLVTHFFGCAESACSRISDKPLK